MNTVWQIYQKAHQNHKQQRQKDQLTTELLHIYLPAASENIFFNFYNLLQ